MLYVGAYAYDLPGMSCRIWVKIFCKFTTDPDNPLSAKLSDGGVDVLPPGGG